MRFTWILLFLLGLLSACHKESADPALLFGQNSGCKDFSLKTELSDGPTSDCLYYSYFDNTLIIKHVNVGFNCCPEGFKVELQVLGDTLVIRERENSNVCDCSCLFDLEYSLTDVEKKTWWIRVDEEYVGEDMEPMFFEIDLKNDPEGKWCVERTHYPWGDYYNQ